MLDKHARHALLEAHTWAGLAIGLVLHAMFFFGAIALFHEDLATWEDPSQHATGQRASFGDALALARGSLPEGTRSYSLALPPEGSRTYALWFLDPDSDRWQGLSLDPTRGSATPRDTHASQLLFSLHFLWHEAAPALYYVAGVVSAILLLAIVTGLLIHLRQLAPQFGRFRPETSPRVALTDLHKVLGVIGLPFQLVFAFTGAFLVLAPVLVRSYADLAFDGDHDRVTDARRSAPTTIASPAPIEGGLDAQIAAAGAALPGIAIDVVNVDDAGTVDETIELQGPVPGAFAGEGTLRFRAGDGAMLSVDGPQVETAVYSVRRFVTGLHYAKFGGASLRAIYAILALATAATALSGVYVWILRRDSVGSRFLRAATEATATGSWLATALVLLAARLVPAGHEHRVAIEDAVFFGSWALVYLDAAIARSPTPAFVRHLVLAGVASIALPVATALVSDAGLVGALLGRATGHRAVVGVDLVATCVGVVALVVAALVARARRRSTRASVASITPLASTDSSVLAAARPLPHLASEVRHG